jgi:hypothetical protein
MGNLATAKQPPVKKGKASGLRKLVRETQSSDDDDEDNHSTPAATDIDPSKPWRPDFKNYVDTLEANIPPGMSTIQWWGVCI